MYIGQLLKTLLEWLKRWLWSHDNIGPKPFTAIREKQYPLAILRLVEGRDTPQSQRTWVISPKKYGSDHIAARRKGFPGFRLNGKAVDGLDIHIYLDFIGAVDGMGGGQCRSGPTHQGSSRSEHHEKKCRGKGHTPNTPRKWLVCRTHTITILRASRRLNWEGSYTYEHIFSGQYDFQGQMTTAADVQARIVCDRLAILRGMHDISDVMWVDEVEEIHRQIMGKDGLPHTQAFKIWRVERSPISSKPRFPRKPF